MSAEENKAMYRRLIEEAFNKGNVAVLDEIIASNFIAHTPFGELKGQEGAKQAITGMHAAFPDIHYAIEDIVAEGDTVAAQVRLQGTFKGAFIDMAPTGKQLNIIDAYFVRFDGGKAVEQTGYMDTLAFYQQLGIPIPAQ